MAEVIFKFKSRVLLGLLSLFLLYACGGPQSAAHLDGDPQTQNDSPPPLQAQFPSLPFPPEHEMDQERTFIYESGRGEVKIGGIHLIVPNQTAQVARFYLAEMKERDWKLIRRIDHEGTALLYESSSSICSITIKPELATTRVTIEIGPK